MQRYVNQLLEDIKRITIEQDKVFLQDLDEDEFSEDIEKKLAEVDRYVSEDPIHNMYDHFGLRKEAFPPAEKLSDDQLDVLLPALVNLWRVHHIEVDFPEGAPSRIVYPLFLESMDRPVFMHTFGTLHMEFCEYDATTCPFKEYCDCFLDELNDDMTDREGSVN